MYFDTSRIDENNCVKVADFGLARDVYQTDYYRCSRYRSRPLRLPIKWMAPESIDCKIFSSKSDVVRLIVGERAIS